MDISTTVLDDSGGIVHRSRFSVDGLTLVVAAESRQEMARKKGKDWTHGAITFFGNEVLIAIRDGKMARELERSACNLAMAVWVFDSVFEGQTTEQFLQTDLMLTVTSDGSVRYDKHRKPSA